MKTTKKDKKSNEPFPPENTPTPPHVMNPNASAEREEKTASKEDPAARQSRDKPSPQSKEPKEKLLGESEIEIDDETTI